MKSAQLNLFFCSKGNPESYKKWSHFDELMLAVTYMVSFYLYGTRGRLASHFSHLTNIRLQVGKKYLPDCAHFKLKMVTAKD